MCTASVRTGRAGNRGCAISLVEAHDMAMVAKIERYTEGASSAG